MKTYPPHRNDAEIAALRAQLRTLVEERRRSRLCGRKFSDEHKLKMSIAATGKKQSPETRAKRSASLTGKTFSPERKLAISEGIRRAREMR